MSENKLSEEFCDELSESQTLSDGKLEQISGGSFEAPKQYWRCRDCGARQIYSSNVTQCDNCGSTNLVFEQW